MAETIVEIDFINIDETIIETDYLDETIGPEENNEDPMIVEIYFINARSDCRCDSR